MKISVIESGLFKLDGGAMFGVVPKVMWNKMNPADENNLCTWTMRCLLIESGNRKILIDTGMGDKQDERFRSHFHPHGDDDLVSSVNKHVSVEEITDVFITHFHFDHVGGAVSKDKNGHLLPTFPNATYWSNEKHYKWAIEPNARERASFLKENFVPLKEQGVLKFIDVEENVEWLENIRIRFYNGHTEAMMVPFIPLEDGRTIVFPTDLLPSTHHVRLPYVMAYDIRPLETVKERKEFYDIVTDGNHLIIFEHDKDTETGYVVKNDKGRYSIENKTTLDLQISND